MSMAKGIGIKLKDRKIKSLIDQIKKLKVADENSLFVIHRNKKSEDRGFRRKRLKRNRKKDFFANY